ncbi:MAG: hypothetical protein Q8L44_07935 [Sulfuritalea sp.]|nr:hypothetical protein [Sulfuritalea sp.]
MTAKRRKPTGKELGKPNPATLLLDERYLNEGDRERYLAAKDDAALEILGNELAARAMSQPEVRAAATIQEFEGGSLNVNYLVNELREQVGEVQRGRMTRPEAMLMAQAHTLDALFSNLARRSHSNSKAGYLDAADRYLRLALKAQSQAVRTIEALGELKNPRPVTFVRQANVAHNQQVNNGMASQAGESENRQSKQSAGDSYELLPDTRASQTESRIDPPMETVGEIDRAEVVRR